jgi:hypothetical protein
MERDVKRQSGRSTSVTRLAGTTATFCCGGGAGARAGMTSIRGWGGAGAGAGAGSGAGAGFGVEMISDARRWICGWVYSGVAIWAQGEVRRGEAMCRLCLAGGWLFFLDCCSFVLVRVGKIRQSGLI